MKNEDIMKYVLGAGAVYLLYLWAEEQGWLEGILPQPQLQPPVEPPSEEVPAPPPAAPPPPPTEEDLRMVASQSFGGASWDGKANADQWNEFYSQLSGVRQTTDLFPPEDRGYRMTVGEYWQQRRQAGLGALARLPVTSAWTN